MNKPRLPQTEKDCRIYAIGDIHGQLALLKQLHGMIADDMKARPAARCVLVYVGDYVDRSLESRQTVDYVLSGPLGEMETVFLLGNHEFALMEFLNHHDRKVSWLEWGGHQTVESYGVRVFEQPGKRRDLHVVCEELRAAIPESHYRFYQSLRYFYLNGDFLFVHGGIRPDVPLDQQSTHDLLTIRDDFIYGLKQLPYTVVFGHTTFEEPFVDVCRIGIDTGAYATGKLTAACIENSDLRFLHT